MERGREGEIEGRKERRKRRNQVFMDINNRQLW
jgi:hypothetical protein